jgi:hypothetical protein
MGISVRKLLIMTSKEVVSFDSVGMRLFMQAEHHRLQRVGLMRRTSRYRDLSLEMCIRACSGSTVKESKLTIKC